MQNALKSAVKQTQSTYKNKQLTLTENPCNCFSVDNSSEANVSGINYNYYSFCRYINESWQYHTSFTAIFNINGIGRATVHKLYSGSHS